jgi:cellulose synthase/poly-beta-1,6-N-acetylglucosamine synthase-like glycosyltransferase
MYNCVYVMKRLCFDIHLMFECVSCAFNHVHSMFDGHVSYVIRHFIEKALSSKMMFVRSLERSHSISFHKWILIYPSYVCICCDLSMYAC